MRYLPNGQWTLEKNDELPKPSIHNLVGETHTVEVHPDMDHLYNVKGLIQQSGRPYLHIGDIKRTGQFPHLINKLPRDATGKVTPEMIDQHIANLPKQKVEVKVVHYDMSAQKHRSTPQYVVSVGLHPDTLKQMSPAHRQTWRAAKSFQHDLGGHHDQMGWARIDPYRVDDEEAAAPNDGHWHLDEIQSDFGTPDKAKKLTDYYADPEYIREELNYGHHAGAPELDELWDNFYAAREAHEERHGSSSDVRFHADNLHNAMKESVQRISAERKAKMGPTIHKDLYKLLSHGHEDPQHLVHSAVNQLARQHGITSTSMDLPEDQAEQSGLRLKNPAKANRGATWQERLWDHLDYNGVDKDTLDEMWNGFGPTLLDNHNADIHFQSATKKLGEEGIRDWADLALTDRSSWIYNGASDNTWDEVTNDSTTGYIEPNTRKALAGMTPDERNALSRFAQQHFDTFAPMAAQQYGIDMTEQDDRPITLDDYDLPVHVKNTYQTSSKVGYECSP